MEKNFDISHITNDLKNRLEHFKRSYSVSRAGRIIYSGDGVIKIDGLKDVKSGELLLTENGVRAIALNLEADNVGAIVLDSESAVSAGMMVSATSKIVEVPVGNVMLGRVVNSFGQPIDGLSDIKSEKFRPIETASASITERAKINKPLQTGILAIDSMIPIGRGQRELIIGDRQTGKTALAIDAILNQKGKDVCCVYVSIGQKASTINSIVNVLKEHHAMEYTCVVCSTAKDSAPLQYIAPYSGCAIAEEFMYSGKDVLIVYDDLTKHAVSYRTVALLLKRPPGREAYPGDIFYLHSRLLERAGKLCNALGGGSITALPIVETLAGDISAYIPTNVISITDGQIYLEQELFNAGIRPAVNVGLSVSRVGSAAQIKAMRKVSGKLRLDLSQYRELAVFAQFGSELDASTRSLLDQGERTTETLKQPQFKPMDIVSQIILLYITAKEFLKNVPTKDIKQFNSEFLKYLDAGYPEIRKEIEKTEDLPQGLTTKIEIAVKEFKEYLIQKDNNK